MKIGLFAKKFGTTPANIRYYIDLGLIIPKREGTQYTFDEECADDMEFVIKMKAFGFHLREINELLSIKRMTKFKDKKANNMFIGILEEKKAQLQANIIDLNKRIHMMDQQIKEVSSLKISNKRSGIALSFIPLLACPTCGSPLSFSSANIENNQLISGMLQCGCGYSAQIEDGILVLSDGENRNIPEGSWATLLNDLSTDFINFQIKTYRWMTEKIHFEEIRDKVLITTDRFAGGSILENAKLLSKENKYIIVYSSKSLLKQIKSRMDTLNLGLDILYVLDDSLELPLREESVDIFIDDFSTSNFLFFHKAYPIEKLYKYMKQEALIIGSLFFYRKSSKTIKNIAADYPSADIGKLYSPLEYKRVLGEYGFKIVDKDESGILKDPGCGMEFPFHEKGEELHFYNYVAKVT